MTINKHYTFAFVKFLFIPILLFIAFGIIGPDFISADSFLLIFLGFLWCAISLGVCVVMIIEGIISIKKGLRNEK